MSTPKKMNKFEAEQKKYRENPKWLPKEALVMVEPSFEPQEVKVSGKFGQHTAFIIMTQEAGLVYVNSSQINKIAMLFKGDYSNPMTVSL